MRTIICKKCGMEIDATLGECPNCGAVYYILPEQGNTSDPADEMDETRFFNAEPTSAPKPHETIDIENAMNEDLFNTSIWKNSDEEEFTRVFRATDAQPPRRAAANSQTPRRPAAQPQQVPPRRPVSREVPQRSAPARQTQVSAAAAYDKKQKKIQMAVAGLALLAILVLVLSIMSGAFNFSGKSSSDNKMVSVIGQVQEKALSVLKDSMGLEVTVMQENSDQPVGIVIKQSINEGKSVRKGDSVTITVSSGPDETEPTVIIKVKVPALEGKTYDQASRELANLGLLITTAADVYDENVEAGKVISQNIKSGTEIQKGDMVTVTLSKGKEPCKITVTAGTGGSVNPNGVAEVEKGKDITFIITPDQGFEIREIKVDGTPVDISTSYTFTAVTGNHTLYVVFQKAQESTPVPEETPTPEVPAQ